MTGFPNPLIRERRIRLWHETDGSPTRMAEAEGITVRKMHEWIVRAKRRGDIGDFIGKVPDGMEVSGYSEILGKNGELARETIHTRPTRSEYDGVPEGHTVKGVSTFIDANGNKAGQWVKTAALSQDPVRLAETIKTALENFKPVRPQITAPKGGDKNRLTVYPLADWHLGMFAWGKETEGPDWDLSEARKVLCSTFAELVEQAPPSENAVILGLGDIFHSDNMQNRTSRHGFALDVDTRYQKVLATGCELVNECIEMVANKHRKVDVAIKRGNHDDHSAFALLHFLHGVYRRHERIKVELSPSDFYWKQFGVCLIGGTHGDKQKLTDMPMIMASRQKQAWAETTTRHIFTGHVHHDRVREIEGVRCHSLRAPIPQDAYHAGIGYLSGRSMYAFNFHREKGAKGSIEVEIA